MQQRGGLVVVDIIVVVIALLIAGGVSVAIYKSYADVERSSQAAPTPSPESDIPEINTNPEDEGGELELMTIQDGNSARFDVLIGKF